MTELNATYHARLAKCLASRDRTAAASLLQEVRGALATGTASGPGFQNDVIALSSIAGVPLEKASPGRSEALEKQAGGPTLPPHLEAEANAAIERIKQAGRLEKRAAISHGYEVKARLDDYWRGVRATNAIRAVQHGPKIKG